MELWTKTQLTLMVSNQQTNNEITTNGDGDTVDFMPVVKWFDPYGSATWLITEIDLDNNIAFGLCDLGMGFPELGSVGIDEIKSLKQFNRPRIERDLSFKAKLSLNEYARIARANDGLAYVCEPAPAPYKNIGPDMERVMQAVKECWTTTANIGFCIECGYEQDGCEPDAEGYKCENCGKHTVSGAEQCLLSL